MTTVFQLAFSGKVYYEVCCGGTKKWDAMFFMLISAIKYLSKAIAIQ